MTLAGRPGIEVVPVLPDGLGSSAIILREDWGLTIVRAEGFTSDALREIVLSLYDQAVDGGLPVLDDDACDPTRPPLAVAPDGSGFLALSQGFILSRYDADGCHVDDLVRGINTGTAFDVAWSPAGDRYAYAIVAPPQTLGLTALRVSYFEFRARAPGEFGRDPYRAISGHAFPRGGEAWRWHGRRTGAASRC